MHDTTITVIGNVATKPERRRIETTGDSVLNFRIGSTSRRFDKASGAWVDGNSFFVRVNCWRSLADNAFHSLFTGDPVIVSGRIYTREYEGEDGQKRISYEMDATAVGHNMARGTTKFTKSRPGHATEVLADAEAPPLGVPAPDGEPVPELADVPISDEPAPSDAEREDSAYAFGRDAERGEPVGAMG
ncbi:MAG: single-stranded DNA-binding protein [Micromonosporaceae bacterium]|nr:single-stranded DNA-binding protein [Micromonosporaceae bacterium]